MSATVPPEPFTIPVAVLHALMTDVFTAHDVTAEDARLVADALVEASLSGYDAHGVMRVPRYADDLRRGVIAPRGAFTILKETAASAHVNGGRALGPVTATRAVALACAKAAAVGVGCVSTCNSNDIGRLGSYLRAPAQQGFLVLILANDSGGLPTVAPHGGAARFFSTNPIGAGIPNGEEEPIVIDMATSVASVGRVRMAAQRNATLPTDVLQDAAGKPVTDPARFFDAPDEVFLLPLGGATAGYKGFALQLLVDVLAGALGGAGVATGVDPGLEANALFVLALGPDHFAGGARFGDLVGALGAGLHATPPLPGVDAVRLPGERAAEERRRRAAEGIPLHATTLAELRRTLTDLGLAEKYAAALNHPEAAP
jgi:LDH2 family malate/lactate/ureidoglycolate dehydrogenase